MERLHKIIFDPAKNYLISLVVFWTSLILTPTTMLLRGFMEGWDLFEQVILAISWFAIIETARNSVITSLIEKGDDD